jgi:uncharacterized protein YgiM (DUF1202 family)
MFQAALRAVGVGLWLTVCSPSAWAQAAVVKRNVNLRDGPDTSFTILRLLLPGEELTLRTPERDVGYYSVRTADGAEGWVWANNIRVLAESTATSTVGPPEVFDGCGLEGNAQSANRRALNRLKNRVVAPTAAQVDGTITLAAILVPGDDRARWSTDQAADVTGYVVAVKAGARETVNCGASGIANTDAHIELALNASATDKTQRVIVEVTPRWRWFEAQQGVNWSTSGLRTQLVGKCAAFTGWMLFDNEHDDEAQNTAPNASNKWRATAWEVHPVTSIRVVPCPS